MTTKTKTTKTAKRTVKKVKLIGLDPAKRLEFPKGFVNPRRKGSAPYKRFEVLLNCKTVGDFLKKMPKWKATIKRAAREGHVTFA